MAAAEKQTEHIGETKAVANHDHDMIHELSKRIDAVWRYDQYIFNAEGHIDLQNFWRNVKTQEEENVRRLKEMITEHCRNECF